MQVAVKTDMPPDVQRHITFDELPPSVKEIPSNLNPIAKGVLMQHQVNWCKDDSDLKLGDKGRRTGITFAEALDDTITAASKKTAGGDNVYYIGDTKEKGLEFIGYCATFAKVMASSDVFIEQVVFEDKLKNGKSRSITSYRIRFASGYQIMALSSRPASIRGLQGIVVIDEAAFHERVAEVINAANALLIWGGKIRIISTHNGVLNPFNQLIQEALAGKNNYSVHHIPFDTAVENGLYERVCFMKGEEPTSEGKKEWYNKIRESYGTKRDVMREELDAIPREGSGVYLYRAMIEGCMREEVPIIELALQNAFIDKTEEEKTTFIESWCDIHLKPLLNSLNKNNRHYFGEDFARSHHLTCIAPMELRHDMQRRVPFLVQLRNVPHDQQKQILFYIVDGLPRFSGGKSDAKGNGSYLAEAARIKYGSQLIEEVQISDKWYREIMPKVKAAFEDKTIWVPKHSDVLDDLSAFQVINGVPKLPKGDTKSGSEARHGDSGIAIILAYDATNMENGGIEWTPAPKHKRWNGSKKDDKDKLAIKGKVGW